MNEENIIRKILKSEVSWLIFIVGAIYAFVSQIVIPIKTLQITVDQVHASISDQVSRTMDNTNRISAVENHDRGNNEFGAQADALQKKLDEILALDPTALTPAISSTPA